MSRRACILAAADIRTYDKLNAAKALQVVDEAVQAQPAACGGACTSEEA